MDMTKEFADRDSFVHWFLIAAIAGQEITDEMKAEPRLIRMTLNNVEIDPLRAIRRLEEEVDRLIEKRATEMVNELHNQLTYLYDDAMDNVHQAVKEFIQNYKK